MGRASRAKREQRWARARQLRRADVGVVMGWSGTTDPTKLDEPHRKTHDILVAQLGDQRTGPVSWRDMTGRDARRFLANAISESTQPASIRYYRELDKRLRLEGGTLTVASAPAQRAVQRPESA